MAGDNNHRHLKMVIPFLVGEGDLTLWWDEEKKVVRIEVLHPKVQEQLSVDIPGSYLRTFLSCHGDPSLQCFWPFQSITTELERKGTMIDISSFTTDTIGYFVRFPVELENHTLTIKVSKTDLVAVALALEYQFMLSNIPQPDGTD
ncbi:hypothetical protein COU94_00920 [Candidatus Shapirobacteria bacterium CG10_big_fil_rev_8_21_14_0_10_38_8]|nr:MAG: hypothetical protein COU94_00920 [Candidatus Shapirobacteria bacterium CG10_big_fil_rev_8_21_14_0_10_38_8]